MIVPKAIQNFPKTYRPKEMRVLAHWLRAGDSGAVIGLAGCGLTNLLNFLCYRPDVLRDEYLGAEANKVTVIPVDLNHLPTNDIATLYRVFLRAFYWVERRLPDNLRKAVTALYLEYRATSDPFLAQSALYEMLQAFQAEGMRVALVLNRFDTFCQEADPRMFATLRGLRDSFKEILSFIVGMYREVIYLPNPQVLGDLYPLLDNNVCWVGPMNETDARWVIQQALYAAPDKPGEPEIQTILALSGGFPELLRFITAWWVKQNPKPPVDEWLPRLSNEPIFEHRLRNLWNGLTQEEQSALSTVQEAMGRVKKAENSRSLIKQTADQIKRRHGDIMPRLVEKGLCAQTERGWQIGSLLWADFMPRLEGDQQPSGKFRFDLTSNDITQDGQSITLSPQEHLLLSYLIKRPYKRHNYQDLILVVWPEDHDPLSRKQDLFQLVRSVRKKIEPSPSQPRYLITWTDQQDAGYKFYPEGQPLGLGSSSSTPA